MNVKDKPNKITTALQVVVTADFYDDEASEETVRYCVEQDLEDAGFFEVNVDLLKDKPEIVQCKDCVNCIKEPNGELYCDVLAIGYEPLGSKKVTEDWFCADGERR